MDKSSSIHPTDAQANLEYLTDIITIHFKNLRDADSCSAQEHARMLKDHINLMATTRPKSDQALDFIDSSNLMRLPRAISRFAPRATVNPSLNWGLFGRLPRELRDIIYKAVLLSHDCPPSTYIEACTCTQEFRRNQSGLALLRTCAKIHNEALPLIYAPETFALTLGLPTTTDALQNGPSPEWQGPLFYRETLFGQQAVAYLPHHALRLIQSLSLIFTTEAIMWSYEALPEDTESQLLQRLGQGIARLCDLLRDEAIVLQHLDVSISLYFPCDSSIDSENEMHDLNMVVYRLLKPLLQLRGVPETSITLRGFDTLPESERNLLGSLHPPAPEARWELTDDFMAYFHSVLGTAQGVEVPEFTKGNDEDLEILEDDYDDEEWIEEHPWHEIGSSSIEDEELFMRKYLRDVYGTENLEALHGGMPERWVVWLNSDHGESCDWFDAEDEEEEENL